MRRASMAFVLAALVPVAIGACGGGGNESASTPATTATTPAAGGQTLQLAADPSGALKFDKKSLSAKAGVVTIDLTNDSPISHDVVIAKGSEQLATSEIISQSTATATAKLQPGNYVFYCSVDGHRDAGMQGTLTVK
jgi:uncharacterized cupredoxin-like copper-binding protein